MKRRAVLGALAALAILLIAGMWLRDLQRRADDALKLQAAALASQGGVAEALTTERTAAATVVHFDRAVAPVGLGLGWYAPEPGLGTWTSGRQAAIRLVGLPAGRVIELALTLRALVGPGRPVQRLRIGAGGRTLADLALSTPGFQTVRVAVPPEAQGPAGTVELTWELPDADSPARLTPGSQDHRLLAVMLKTLAIPT